jgi:hypothetical protein
MISSKDDVQPSESPSFTLHQPVLSHAKVHLAGRVAAEGHANWLGRRGAGRQAGGAAPLHGNWAPFFPGFPFFKDHGVVPATLRPGRESAWR